MFVNDFSTNVARASIAWGNDMPRWVNLLATACDKSSQRAIADRLSAAGFACSNGTISKLINNKYPASTAEPERAVLAVFGGDEVRCPVWGEMIPLQSCLRTHRRKGLAGGVLHHFYARVCPTCPNNTLTAGTVDHGGIEP